MLLYLKKKKIHVFSKNKYMQLKQIPFNEKNQNDFRNLLLFWFFKFFLIMYNTENILKMKFAKQWFTN